VQSPPIGIGEADGPVAPYTETPCELLPTFFALFLLFGAAAENMHLELIIVRATIANRENFMIVFVGYEVVLLNNRSARVSILCLPL
jgi:hypothetical protein